MSYFEYFPSVEYDGVELLDISRRIDIIDPIKMNTMAFLPYTIEDDSRPEDIAYHYYGDVSFTWLVYMANEIVDVNAQWPKTAQHFNDFIIAKYKEVSGLTGDAVVEWAQNETIDENIIHYKKVDGDVNDIISVDTYTLGADLINGFIQGEWEPVRIYTYEELLENEKRSIFLVNKTFANQMQSELKEKLNG